MKFAVIFFLSLSTFSFAAYAGEACLERSITYDEISESEGQITLIAPKVCVNGKFLPVAVKNRYSASGSIYEFCVWNNRFLFAWDLSLTSARSAVLTRETTLNFHESDAIYAERVVCR